jgi:hypothetical protein
MVEAIPMAMRPAVASNGNSLLASHGVGADTDTTSPPQICTPDYESIAFAMSAGEAAGVAGLSG